MGRGWGGATGGWRRCGSGAGPAELGSGAGLWAGLVGLGAGPRDAGVRGPGGCGGGGERSGGGGGGGGGGLARAADDAEVGSAQPGRWRRKAAAARSWWWGMRSAARRRCCRCSPRTPTPGATSPPSLRTTLRASRLTSAASSSTCGTLQVVRTPGSPGLHSCLRLYSAGPAHPFLCSSYYDNVRPLAYPDSDAVLICFDISRPETLDNVLKKWQGETQEFCPNAKVVLVGCKLDMRTDLATLRELSKQRLIPVTHEQGTVLAKQVGAVSYVECSSRSSERSVRDVFHVATVASLGHGHRQLRRADSRRGLQRSTPLSGRLERGSEVEIHKDRAKSCSLM
ncbi:rho-related GTP-binding protein RhoN isoform X2 [Cavia porcellus]|uniref:rho-related GTP-binding protein RhoN isoform X2 n=1 Tax=Cavia porcellus TaxID=10141 RepID=UPI002FE3EEEF